ncbi:MAG: CYTH domain-containing protein [Verrucomicrobia bacterium]|nr:CYTH domain-containing protein [Verrucomicrobiota bacterium]MCH8525779.1 CYTH domain-containing protein [Kiritimatiellia bacterium]
MSLLELELKLNLPPDVQEAKLIAELASVFGSMPEPVRSVLADAYWDTRNGALRRAGWSLRLREGRGRRKLTLKSLETLETNLAVREEAQVKLPKNLPFPPLPDLPGFEEARDRLAGENLETFITLEKTQTAWALCLENDLTVEITFDRVRVREHPEVPTFAELEVELLSGDPEAFRVLALSLENALGYPASTESKLARVLRFV